MSKIQNPIETTSTETNTQSVFELVQQMKAENEKLQARLEAVEWKTGAVAVSNSKKRFEWQLQACYWLWWTVPVVSYESCKKEEEYDYLYKNPDGRFVDNHYVIITTADWEKTKKVLRTSFALAKTQSDLKTFSVLTKDGDVISKVTSKNLPTLEVDKYIFNVPWFGEIQVSPNCIN